MSISLSFAPLLAQPLWMQAHAFAALALIPLTVTIFALPRGSHLHRVLGWAWVIGMAAVALSSFAIQDMRLIGPFSPIHGLSVFTLVMLVLGVRAARGKRVAKHRQTMKGLTFGALIGAGLFTLMPGRVMYQVVFGL